MFRLSLRGETPAKRPRAADPDSLSESAGYVRPFAFRRLDDASARKDARLLAVERIEVATAQGDGPAPTADARSQADHNRRNEAHIGWIAKAPRFPSFVKTPDHPSKFNSISGRPNSALPSVK